MSSDGVYFRFRKIDNTNNLLARFDRACEVNGLDRSEAIRQFMYDFVNKTERKSNLPPITESKQVSEVDENNTSQNENESDVIFDLKISGTSEYLKKINYTPSWRKK